MSAAASPVAPAAIPAAAPTAAAAPASSLPATTPKGTPIGGPPLLTHAGSMLVTGARVEYPKLIVLKATYGLTKNSDVLVAIRKQQHNQEGGLSFPQKAEFNWSLGDPEPGANKSLKLWWKYGEDGDEQYEQWFENGGRKAVLLPKDDRPSEKYVGPLYFSPIKASDVAGYGSKVKALYVKVEINGVAAKSPVCDAKQHGDAPSWAGTAPLAFEFDGKADAKTTVTVSLCQSNFLVDDVIGRTTVALAVLSGDRSPERVLELMDEKTRKTVTAKLHFHCLYKGRGGPRAPRSKGTILDTNSSQS